MNGWSIAGPPSARFVRCAAFDPAQLVHGFGLRCVDVGPAVAPDGPQLEARRRLVAAVGCGAGPELRLLQVHGASVVHAIELDERGVEADGCWAATGSIGGQCLAVRSADCVPLLIATRDGRYVAAVHAGWRGTRSGIAGQAIDALERAGGRAADTIVAIGPAIGPCCYEVSAEVAGQVAAASGPTADRVVGGTAAAVRLDLPLANRLQFIAAGIAPDAIHSAPWCTACAPREFFSYRRDGGSAGRQLSLIGPLSCRP